MDTVQAPQRIFMLIPAHSLQLHLANTPPQKIGVISLVWEQGNQLQKRSHDWNKMPDLISWWVVKTSKNMFPSLWWINYQRILHFLQKSHHSAKPTLSPQTRHPRRWRWGPFFSGFGRFQGNVPFKGHPRGWELEWAHCQAWLRKWEAELGVSCWVGGQLL